MKNRLFYRLYLMTALLIVVAVLFNAILASANMIIRSPFFLDSIGTALIAAFYGPLPGILTGIFTNITMDAFSGFSGNFIPFALCNASTGLIVGCMVKNGRFRTFDHAAETTGLVTIANTLIGALIASFLFGGLTGVGIDNLVTGFILMGGNILTAAFWARIPANLVDKSLTILIAFWAYKKFYSRFFSFIRKPA